LRPYGGAPERIRQTRDREPGDRLEIQPDPPARPRLEKGGIAGLLVRVEQTPGAAGIAPGDQLGPDHEQLRLVFKQGEAPGQIADAGDLERRDGEPRARPVFLDAVCRDQLVRPVAAAAAQYREMVHVTVRADILIGGDPERRPIGALDRGAFLAVTTLEGARDALAVAQGDCAEQAGCGEVVGVARGDVIDGVAQVVVPVPR
jgi:hypothetical protein